MPEPIELTERDIIRRPLELPSAPVAEQGGKNPFGWIKDIKENIAQVKELMDTLKELGITMPSLGNLGKTGNIAQPGQEGQNPQMQAFLQAIKAQYGNLTVKQMMAVLLDKYGDKKLEDLIK